MWYTKQKMRSAPCTGFKDVEVVETEGKLEYKQVDLCSARLPSTDKFDLEMQIKSGVDMQQQNTAILQPGISEDDLDELEKVFGQSSNSDKQDKQDKKDGE